VVKFFIEKVLSSLQPDQLCWLCMAFTTGAVVYATSVFARSDEVEKLSNRLSIVVRISLSQEIREIQKSLCVSPSTKDEAYLERLQIDYELITGQRYPEGKCR
jgi:hypothetical protein